MSKAPSLIDLSAAWREKADARLKTVSLVDESSRGYLSFEAAKMMEEAFYQGQDLERKELNRRIKGLEEALEEARRPNPVWERLDAVAEEVLDLHQKVQEAPKMEFPDATTKKLALTRGILYEIRDGIAHKDLDVSLEEIDNILKRTSGSYNE